MFYVLMISHPPIIDSSCYSVLGEADIPITMNGVCFIKYPWGANECIIVLATPAL